MGWGCDHTAAPPLRRCPGLVGGRPGAWSTELCDETPKVDAVCIRIYRAFIGPDGRTLSGPLLAPDHAHPSQAGNDLIRDVLIESGLADGIWTLAGLS
jgi:hypothetical protein